MTTETRLSRLLLLFTLASLPAVGWAAEVSPADLQRAKELYDNGALLYEEGNYQAAILAFQQSLAISGAPALNYNIANCYERLGKLTEARDALNLYRAVAPSDERERLDRRLAAIEQRIAEEAAKPVAPPPAAVTPAPVAPTTSTTTKSGGGAKWAVFGAGVAVGVVGGGLITYGWADSKAAYEAGDRDTYETDRLLNQIGYGVAGAGLAAAVVGLVLPSNTATVGATPIDGGLVFSLSSSW